MAREPLEVSIEEYLVKQIKKHFSHFELRKFEAQRNDPDRLLFLPEGRAVLVEVKRPKADLRDGQIRAAKRFKALGFDVYSANTKEKVDDLIKTLLGI